MVFGGCRFGRAVSSLCIALLLAACGGEGGMGGGSSAGSGTSGTTSGQTQPPPVVTPPAACSLRARQDWLLAEVNEWYLFPETLTYVPPTAFTNPAAYLDALTATARAQGKDRFFSYLTSIAEEDAYYQSGETPGIGVRFAVDAAARRLWVSDSFEGGPAAAAGIARGAEIVSVGTSPATLRAVGAILASEGEAGLYMALGPDTNGTTRSFGLREGATTRIVTLTKTTFAIPPVSTRVITDNGRKIGYLNLRTFIFTAEPALRDAFARFKADGIDELIVDLRYNGGGLISVAQTLGSLLGGARQSSDLFARLSFRPEKAAENEDYLFRIEANAIAPRRIAFIATADTASASELVINALRPFMRGDIALIGDNTYGKPVGQIALDRAECDDRLRLIALQTANAAGDTGYFTGLAPLMERSCRARDDLQYPLGDPAEDSVARAVDFLDQRACTPITGSGTSAFSVAAASRVAPVSKLTPLVRDQPSRAQRDMPGFF